MLRLSEPVFLENARHRCVRASKIRGLLQDILRAPSPEISVYVEQKEHTISCPCAVCSKVLKGDVYVPSPPQPPTYFKLVAFLDGKYLSIYDGQTEYRLGVTLSQPCDQDHKGGYFVYRFENIRDFKTVTCVCIRWWVWKCWDEAKLECGWSAFRSQAEAQLADLPRCSRLFIAPRVILQCLAWGDCVEYDNGKLAFGFLLPLAIIPSTAGYTCNKVRRLYSVTPARFTERSMIARHTIGQGGKTTPLGASDLQRERQITRSVQSKHDAKRAERNTRALQADVQNLEGKS
jgi:hypothetical protein